MLLHSPRGKSTIKVIELLICSSLLSLALSFCFYAALKELVFKGLDSTEDLFSLFKYVIGLLLAVIFTLMGLLFNKVNKEQEFIRELRTFKDFTDALHRSSNEMEVYDTLFTYIRRISPIDHTALFYLTDSSIDDALWQKITNEKIPLCNMSPKSCPLIKLEHESFTGDIEKNLICPCQLPEHQLGNYVCLPIVSADNVQSILQLYKRTGHPLSSGVIAKVKSYIEIAKPVISSKRALQSLNRKAITDKLTKLYNRSFLDSYLENQIEAAALSEQPLSIIIIDLDHFKSINDTYGHTAGDHVLRVFAEIALKCIRKTDLMARYGGEEFMVVLPSTPTDTAVSVAERIRHTISETHIPEFDGIQIPCISCSLGVSTYPSYCNNKNSLIKTADLALYRAKQSGRNRCVVSGE